jgi:hypothetical protein
VTVPTVYRCALAWLPDGRVAADVDVEVADGRIVAGGRVGQRSA